jgi:hypothetical protein
VKACKDVNFGCELSPGEIAGEVNLGGDYQNCPYGRPGDLLWVRETWAHYQTVNHRRCSDGRSFDEVSDGLAGYRADGHNTIEDFRNHIRLMSGCDLEAVLINGDRWRPSIHMPRWACRIVLKITDVRVELLQEISEKDCWSEGIEELDGYYGNADICATAKSIGVPMDDARATYAHLWDALNSGRGYGWKSNPWVWVIEFKRVEVPGA